MTLAARTVRRLVLPACMAALMIGVTSHPLAQSPPKPAELAPITWIVGTWVGHQGDAAPGGSDVIMDVRWTPNGQALQMDLTTVRGAASQAFMSALYYWHPGTRAITMWQILVGGTVNDGRVVTATEAGLTQELRATDHDGKTRLLRTEFVRDGADQFRFIASSRASAEDPWVPNTPIRFARKSQHPTSLDHKEY